MANNRNIPLFIVEEHHEAFIAWNHAVQKGWLPNKENCLLHVDAHSDKQKYFAACTLTFVTQDIVDILRWNSGIL